MESKFFLGYALVLVFVVTLSSVEPRKVVTLSSGEAQKFYVGEKDGWVPNPHENYSHWAQRHRFHVNDTLVFKYRRGYDAVLVMKKNGFDNCDLKHPMQNLSSGSTFFTFHKSGHHYFISGIAPNCRRGQKLEVVVMSPHHKKRTPKTPSPASPPSHPKAPTMHPPPSPKTSPAVTPPSHSKAPVVHHQVAVSPVHPPAASPAGWEYPAPGPAPSSASGLVSSLGIVLGLSGSVAALIMANAI